MAARKYGSLFSFPPSWQEITAVHYQFCQLPLTFQYKALKNLSF